MKKLIISSMLTMLSGLVYAGQVDTTLQTNSTVNASCTMTLPNMPFPSAGISDGAVMQSSLVSYCTKGTSYVISFGTGSSGTYTERSMKSDDVSNTDKLIYNVYRGPSAVNKFGDGTNGTVTSATYTGNGAVGNGTIFNVRITAGQFPKPDTYKDTIAVKITY